MFLIKKMWLENLPFCLHFRLCNEWQSWQNHFRLCLAEKPWSLTSAERLIMGLYSIMARYSIIVPLPEGQAVSAYCALELALGVWRTALSSVLSPDANQACPAVGHQRTQQTIPADPPASRPASQQTLQFQPVEASHMTECSRLHSGSVQLPRCSY